MKLTVESLVVTLTVLILSYERANSQNTCSYPPCFDVPQGITYFYPNWNDCSTYWKCENGTQNLLRCPSDRVFDFMTFQCKSPPTRSGFAYNPVISCSVLLNGLDSLTNK